PDRLLLLGHENETHPAGADLLHELVRTEDRAGALPDRLIDGGDRVTRRRPALQEIPGRLMGPQQRFDPRALPSIPGARPVEEGGPFFWTAVLDRFAQNGHELTVWFVHDDLPRA